MTAVAATLHAPGLAVAGEPCTVEFLGESLVIRGKITRYLPADALSVQIGGFHDDTLFLHGNHQGEAVSVSIADAAAQQTMVAAAPQSLAAQLRRGNRGLRFHQHKWRLVVAMLGAVALSILFIWWQNEAVTAWAANKVPLSREQRLGEIWLKQLQAEGGLREQGPSVAAVRELGARITQGSRFQYRWLVLENPTVNAFAGPGGVVVVHTALIARAESAEELAGVLAHESQHVERRHVLQSMIHSAGWAAMLAVALGDVSAITGVLIHQVGNMRHSRHLEREADAGGVKSLVRSGIAPDGMVRFLRKLQAENSGDAGAAFELLSSHPATEERLVEVERLARAAVCECRPIAIDWAAVRADVATSKVEP